MIEPRSANLVPLKRLVRFAGGGTPSKDRADFWGGGIPWVSPKDMKRAWIDSAADTITEDALRAGRLPLVPPGSVLIVVRGMILAHSFPVAITTVPVAINQDMKALLPGSRLDPRYLSYVLAGRSPDIFAFRDEAGHGTMAIRMEPFGNWKIALRGRSEQRAIADFLDRETERIDALVAKQRTFLAVIDERREATFSEIALGTSAKTKSHLRYVATVLPGFAFPSAAFSTDEGDMRLLRGVNVHPGQVSWAETVRLNSSDHKIFDRFRLNLDDVVIGMDRPWISDGLRVARIAADDIPSLLVQRVARIRCGPRLLPRYAEIVLRSREFWKHVEPDMTGVSVPHISDAQIGSFRVPVPSLADQENQVLRVQRELDGQDRLLRLSGECVARLREHRSALITTAVTGGLAAALYVAERGPAPAHAA